MRDFVLLPVLLLLATPAAAQPSVPVPVPVPTVLASVQLSEDFRVQVEDAVLVIHEGDAPALHATLGVWSPVTEQVRETEAPAARAFSWNYPHLQDIVFVDLSVASARDGLPALTMDADFEHRTRTVRPHDGTGTFEPVTVDLWQRQDESGYHRPGPARPRRRHGEKRRRLDLCRAREPARPGLAPRRRAGRDHR